MKLTFIQLRKYHTTEILNPDHQACIYTQSSKVFCIQNNSRLNVKTNEDYFINLCQRNTLLRPRKIATKHNKLYRKNPRGRLLQTKV